ncbi:MAG TPA: CbtA family protein [Pilimelia sp.]|nr:CbtA family protein [Pilimelia sp.]
MRPLTYAGLLGRGVAAGGLAGLAAGVVNLVLVEPLSRAAVRIEETRPAAEDGHHEATFSDGVYTLGGVVALVLVGLALGALFATVIAASAARWGHRGGFAHSGLVAALGFAAVALLPALKYPANPPGVGDGETVNGRTAAYLTLIVAGLALAYGLVRLDAYLSGRGGLSSGTRGAAVAGAAALGAVLLLVGWPANPDAVPADVPASLLWDFRLASLAVLTTLWLVLGVAFGLLTERRAAARPLVTA